MIKKILITDSGKKFLVKNLNKDFSTNYGTIKKEDIQKAKDGSALLSNKGTKFYVFTPSFIDIYSKIKRGAQIIMPKDIALIIAETGIGKNSRVLDAGSGSGALACFLANIVKEVITYEIREDFYNIVKRNIYLLGLKNIKLKKMDIYKGTEEKDIDLVVLDLPEPWNALKPAKFALKTGGFLVTYSPCITSVMETVNKVKEIEEFIYLKTIEAIEREWYVEGRKVRPKNEMIAHTGFLSFVRKVR